MSYRELISIVVPIYKVEDYLEECINSLIQQTYSNIEIILVDDGSPDNCGEICDKYAENDTRIKVIHKSNGGLSDARNEGIKISRGDYIGFVDSDDYVDRRFYEELWLCIRKFDADIAKCFYVSFADGTSPVAFYGNDIKLLQSDEWITETNPGEFSSCVVWNKLYKKVLFNGVEYPVGRHYEDEATTYKLVYKANKIVRTNSKLYFYRQRAGSITHSEKTLQELNQAYLALFEKCLFFDELKEDKLMLFSYSKLLIFLLLKYSIWKKNDEYKKKWTNIIKQNKRMVLKASSVPLKYKLYIWIRTLFMEV